MNKSFALRYCYRFRGAGGVNEALKRNMKRLLAVALGAALSFATMAGAQQENDKSSATRCRKPDSGRFKALKQQFQANHGNLTRRQPTRCHENRFCGERGYSCRRRAQILRIGRDSGTCVARYKHWNRTRRIRGDHGGERQWQIHLHEHPWLSGSPQLRTILTCRHRCFQTRQKGLGADQEREDWICFPRVQPTGSHDGARKHGNYPRCTQRSTKWSVENVLQMR